MPKLPRSTSSATSSMASGTIPSRPAKPHPDRLRIMHLFPDRPLVAHRTGPELEEWQDRLFRDKSTSSGPWPFRNSNRVVWYNKDRDLALIQIVDPENGPLRPQFRLRIAMVAGNNPHAVEARGYPRASKQAERPRDLTPAFGHLTAADPDRPL